MRTFDYERAESFAEAASALSEGKRGDKVVMAGGTDLMGVMKGRLLKEGPETVVSLRGIEDGNYIKEEDGTIEIGALTRLVDLAESDLLKEKAPIVAEAAYSVATPIIRNVATIGGNLCQDVRCWFYRYPHGVGDALDCMRKGGEQCYAIQGENRYHSIFGGMHAGTTPCSHECPAGTDIPAYMSEIRKGNWDRAVQIFMQYNPMPFVTSRVCPHVCQDGCNQCKHGDSVNIHAVERALGDYLLAHADEYYVAPAEETGKKVAIIGAGPGGLAAAFYLRKAGNEVTIYDRMEKPGGVLMYGIPHYRLPKNIVEAYAAQLEKMGVAFKMGVEIGKDITVDELEAANDALYFGTGAWKQPVLGIGGEELTNFGLNFLVEVNKYLEKTIGEEVLVCGGGNVAMDVALTAVRLGAKKVKLVCLEQEWEMPATDEEIARAKEEGVEIYNGWGLDKVLTDAEGKVCGLSSMKCTSVRNEQGRFDPQYDYDVMETFTSDYILLATGQRVDIEFLGEKFASQLKSQRGLINADLETMRTSNPKIYAGGDAVTGPDLAIRAIRGGRVAATSINRDFGLALPEKIGAEGYIHYDQEAVMNKEANKQEELPLGQRTLTAEDSATFAPETAIAEAGRCMNCGCYSVNASDLSPVMVALDADIITTKKTIKAKDFFTTKLKAYDMLDKDELITAVKFKVPEGANGYKKFRVRNAIDFAIVSLAYTYKLTDGKIEDASLVFGGVAPVPVTRENVAELIKGKAPSKELAVEAAELSVADAQPLSHNAYKVEEAKTMIKRLIEDM